MILATVDTRMLLNLKQQTFANTLGTGTSLGHWGFWKLNKYVHKCTQKHQKTHTKTKKELHIAKLAQTIT